MDYDFYASPLMSLLQAGKHHHLPKKQVLNMSDGRMVLSLIKSGYIKRYLITHDGSHSVQAIYGPNDIFPLTPIFRLIFNKDIYRGDETFYYEAITVTHLNSVSSDELLKKLETEPIVYKDLLYVAGMRLGSNILRLDNIALKTAPRRIAHRLLYYCDKFGEQTMHGTILKMPLTHQNLADILNLARETVTHCLRNMQNKGVIEQVGKYIAVPDIERLRHEIR